MTIILRMTALLGLTLYAGLLRGIQTCVLPRVGFERVQIAGRVMLVLLLQVPALWVPTLAAEPVGAHVAREDIEWLDVWLPHTHDKDLPHVLLIGDSITRGYYPAVEAALAGRAYIGRLSTSKSLGDPALLQEVSLVLKSNTFTIIHFNNGLHGSGYSESEYARALPKLIALLAREAPQATLIWASSTDLVRPYEGDHPSELRLIERNRLAAKCATQYRIPVDDLFPIAQAHPAYHAGDGVHFTPEGYAALANQVAAVLSRTLDKKPSKTPEQ